MVSKKHLYSIFIPTIFLVFAIFSFRLFQYITIFVSPFDNSDESSMEVFVIPISTQDQIVGNKKASKTIIAFEDVQCTHCATLHTLIKEFELAHPNTLKVIWKPTSLITIPHSSELAHTYLWCAREQNAFLPYLERLFANQTELSKETLELLGTDAGINMSKLTTCLGDEKIATYLDETKQLAQFLQIQSVPALFIDNRQIPVPNTLSDLEVLLGVPQNL
jgi:protein-disulfide isomerase